MLSGEGPDLSVGCIRIGPETACWQGTLFFNIISLEKKNRAVLQNSKVQTYRAHTGPCRKKHHVALSIQWTFPAIFQPKSRPFRNQRALHSCHHRSILTDDHCLWILCLQSSNSPELAG